MILAQILPEKITPRQREAYSRAIGNWNYCSHFLSNGATKKDIGILLKLELDGERRDFMLSRLLGRLTTFYREDLKKELDKMLETR